MTKIMIIGSIDPLLHAAICATGACMVVNDKQEEQQTFYLKNYDIGLNTLPAWEKHKPGKPKPYFRQGQRW
jgi:hypothetical protein